MLKNIEELVRTGSFDLASRALRALNLSRIPREEALGFSNLARRIGEHRLSLKILNPFMYGERAKQSPAKPEERIGYAAALIRLGALTEAMDILEKMDPARHPDSLLQRSLCLFSQWKYGPAIPLLKLYAASQPASSYSWCVGMVNLAAALIHQEQSSEARKVLAEIRLVTQGAGFSVLHGNSLELAAQLEVQDGCWERALSVLDEAWELLKETRSSTNALYILKWRAVANSLRSGQVSEELRKVRIEAVQLENWETVRDCDFYIGSISGDRALLARLHFGTPFQSYRDRIRASLGDQAEEPEFLPFSLAWTGDDSTTAPRGELDLLRAELVGTDRSLPAGQVLHRLLILLCEDFYKTVLLVSIFSRIFPGERFNPFSSPNRVYQLVRRLRGWLKAGSIPLEITEKAGGYRLKFLKPFAIRIPRDPLPFHQKELEFLKLRSALAEAMAAESRESPFFAAKEALALTGESRATNARLLKWAVEAGKLEVQGQGPSSRYRLVA